MLVRHSIIYILARLLPGGLSMISTAALTRLLDPVRYGEYGLALVIMSIGSVMAFDWLSMSFQRFYQARRDDVRVAPTVVFLFLALLPVTGVAITVCWRFSVFGDAHVALYVIGLVLAWSYAWFELHARYEVANFRPRHFMLMSFARAILVAAGAVAGAWFTGDPIWTAAGYAAGMCLAAVLGRLPLADLRLRNFDRDLARQILAFGLPIAGSMVGGSLIFSGTRALIPVLGSTEQLGLYTAAYLLIQNTLSVAGDGIASAGYSMAVRAVDSGDRAAAREQLLANGSLLVAVLGPASVGLALVAHPLAATLTGANFAPAVAALTPWMAAASFFALLRAHLLDHAFQLGSRPHLQVWVTGLAGASALGLCVLLIPPYGELGAAMAMTAALVLSCAVAWIAGRYAYPVPLPFTALWKVAVGCLAMTPVVLSLPDEGVTGLLARASAGAAVFAIAAIALDLLGSRTRLLALLRRAARR